jgi:putative chitinase
MLNLPLLTRQGYDTTTPVKAVAALMAYVAKRPQAPMMALATALEPYTSATTVGDDPTEALLASAHCLAHFIGQACFETGYFRYLSEIWGPTDAQKGYEGRKDLGNTQPGDGYKFRGRGIFETTGRYNYTVFGKALGLPLDTNPELLEQPDAAVKSAIYFWDHHGLSALAHNPDIRDACMQITHRINGGSLGIDDRLALTQRAFGAMIIQ